VLIIARLLEQLL